MEISFKWSASVPVDQIDVQFIQGMMDRRAVGFFKYGHVRDSQTDGLKNAKARIKMYEKTGNTEFLIDAANYLNMEFQIPRHRKAHFRSTDSDESPGSIKIDGTVRHDKIEKKTRIQREGD